MAAELGASHASVSARKQIIDVFVLLVMGEILEVVKSMPHERIQQCIVQEIADALVQ